MKHTIGCIIMAAGSSDRFGTANKLLEPFAGETIVERVLDSIPFEMLHRCLLVTGTDAIAMFAAKYNIQVIVNSQPRLGIGRTIKMGTCALGNTYDGYMFVVCDQPLLTKTSMMRLITHWQSYPDRIAALGFNRRTGNPVIFPASLYQELAALKDDEYGRVIYNRHQDLLDRVDVTDEYELMDIDTIDDLEILKKHLNKKKP